MAGKEDAARQSPLLHPALAYLLCCHCSLSHLAFIFELIYRLQSIRRTQKVCLTSEEAIGSEDDARRELRDLTHECMTSNRLLPILEEFRISGSDARRGVHVRSSFAS